VADINAAGGIKVPHHGGDFRFVHQPVSHRYRLFRFARVIPLHQHNFFFTGPNATYGAQYWKGASQAVADINAAGGIKGEKSKSAPPRRRLSLRPPAG
jgi:hypothetical protein